MRNGPHLSMELLVRLLIAPIRPQNSQPWSGAG